MRQTGCHTCQWSCSHTYVHQSDLGRGVQLNIDVRASAPDFLIIKSGRCLWICIPRDATGEEKPFDNLSGCSLTCMYFQTFLSIPHAQSHTPQTGGEPHASMVNVPWLTGAVGLSLLVCVTETLNQISSTPFCSSTFIAFGNPNLRLRGEMYSYYVQIITCTTNELGTVITFGLFLFQ